MAIARTLSIGLAGTGGIDTNTQAVSVEGIQELDVSVPAVTTDQEVAFIADVSQVKLIWIWSDKDITIESNATNAAGGQTITLTAYKNFFWEFGNGLTNPLTPDITKLYISNAGAAAAAVKIRYMYDATP